jgi:glycosyltransferase involved in cell wall biosynthesis
MKILVVDPYLTDSHRVWLDGLNTYLDHKILALTLPPYHWKWRMHGGTLELAQQLGLQDFEPDVIIATDMLDLSLFIAQCKGFLKPTIPNLLYFHENQLNYPISEQDEDAQKHYDNHYAFINFSSALLADHLIFNSKFHQRSFISAVPGFLKKFPNHRIDFTVEQFYRKSMVIYPGFEQIEYPLSLAAHPAERPVILWNHRWEYDKNPGLFFETILRLSEEGQQFGLVVVGQQFSRTPAVFEEYRPLLDRHVLQWGFLKNRADYNKWLISADIVVSTSNQDYFGISVVEAIAAGCFPILPNHLAFPEHIPAYLHDQYLYNDKFDLYQKLKKLLARWPFLPTDHQPLGQHVSDYAAKIQVKAYENIFSAILKEG